MIFKNSLNYLDQFFFFIINKTRNFYLYSNIYDDKISKINEQNLEYKPSSILLDCLIKYEKKKIKIEDFSFDSIWENKNLNKKDYKNLQSFFWLFSLDLKSSKKTTQSIINKWIESNKKYNSKSWDIEILSKRIISWLSNSKLTYDDSSEIYKNRFNNIIQKQINHLINEIERTEWTDDKMIGCSAVILAGLSYPNIKKYLNFGLNLVKKIIKLSLDNNGFPKSRNIRQLNLYLKYFVLIREWLKESQNEIPEYIDEIIYYLGQSYSVVSQNKNILFNGNYEDNDKNFDNYLTRFGYKFKSESNEAGGYVILKNKKMIIAMDVGSSPDKKYSSNYQSGALSLEITSGEKKLITNCGYFQNFGNQFNDISKSTATHSTLIIDNHSSCKLQVHKGTGSKIELGIKINKKPIIFKKNYWAITASHDGYLKKYGIIHERTIEFFPEKNKFIGFDKLIKKRNIKSSNFEIRFHLEPNIKTMKTQDQKSIFIDLKNEGWKFTCDKHQISIEAGLYFGKKNSYIENQNIFISGMTENENQNIKWELTKII